MVDPIQGAGGGLGFEQFWNKELTSDQKTTLTEIISQYDPENLSRADMEEMRQQLRASGIAPSREVGSILENAGFDLEALRGPRGGQRPQGPPPPPEDLDIQALKQLQNILQNYDLDQLSSDEQQSLAEELTSAGLLASGLIMNSNG